MSYDIYLNQRKGPKRCPHCQGVLEQSEPECVYDVGNYTSNVAGMWRKALGYSLRDMDGRTAGECLPDLCRAVADMTDPDNRAEYEAMNPENGWGDYAGAVRYLRCLRDGCIDHPDAVIRVSC